MAKSNRRWWTAYGRPPFDPNDWITPNGNYGYSGNHEWPKGEARQVLAVAINESGGYWELAVWNPNMKAVSRYNPGNFKTITKQEAPMAAYERTKYFASRIDENGAILGAHTSFTDTKSETIHNVKSMIGEGQRWLVLQTVCLVEGEEPRPPIRITEYK